MSKSHFQIMGENCFQKNKIERDKEDRKRNKIREKMRKKNIETNILRQCVWLNFLNFIQLVVNNHNYMSWTIVTQMDCNKD